MNYFFISNIKQSFNLIKFFYPKTNILKKTYKEELNKNSSIIFLVTKNAIKKAQEFYLNAKENGIIISTCTLFSLNNKVLKIKNKNFFLKQVSGKKVNVFSCVCVIDLKTAKRYVKISKLGITFNKLNDNIIKNFLKKSNDLFLETIDLSLIKKINGDISILNGFSTKDLLGIIGEIEND